MEPGIERRREKTEAKGKLKLIELNAETSESLVCTAKLLIFILHHPGFEPTATVVMATPPCPEKCVVLTATLKIHTCF